MSWEFCYQLNLRSETTSESFQCDDDDARIGHPAGRAGVETQLQLAPKLPSGGIWACKDPVRTWWLHELNLFGNTRMENSPDSPMLCPWAEALLCGVRSRVWLATITPALFSNIGFNFEIFPGAGGPWKTASCFQMSLRNLPESPGDRGYLRVQALPKMLFCAGEDFWSCPRSCARCSSTLFDGNGLFGVVFLSAPGCNMKWRQFASWAPSWLPVGHQGCVVPWLLSAGITGAAVMVYSCCIAVPELKKGGSLLVSPSLANCSDRRLTLVRGPCETELLSLLW